MQGETAEDPTLYPAGAGQKLRAAREAQGLDLPEVAARTRIPQRHLEAIESSNYTGLPSTTYAIGFARAYARAVGMDEVEIARDVRRELGDRPERAAPTPSYAMTDPARVPPRGLALAGLAVALIVLVGVILWYGTDLFRGSAPPPEPLVASENSTAPADASAAAAPSATGGQVTLVALDSVWVRITDAGGKRLLEKELAKGDRYEIPPDANGPRLRTGRPDRLQVLINGSVVAPLSTAVTTVNAEVSAAALQARNSTASPAPITSAGGTTTAPTPVETPGGNAADVD